MNFVCVCRNVIKKNRLKLSWHNFLELFTLFTSKLKEFADDNFKFDKHGRKFAKRVGNTVGKGEIARYMYEQVFLLLQCFQKSYTRKNLGLFWKRLTHYHTMPHLTH